MSHSIRRLYHQLEKETFKQALFSTYTRSSNSSLTGITIRELSGPASNEPSLKHIEDLSDEIAVLQKTKWLHTSHKSLLVDKANGSSERHNVKEAPCSPSDELKNNTERHASLHNAKGPDMEEASHPSVENKEEADGTARSSFPKNRNPVSWLSFCLLLVTGAGLISYYYLEKNRRINAAQKAIAETGAGKPAIGGPFKLINHEGKEMTNEQLKGNWTMLYFGFTHCPDICPDELQKMVEAIDLIEKKTNLQVTPVFISVDPERDSVEQMREYVKEFHPRLIGLTGSVEDIKQIARAYRVYYMKTHEEGSDYLVDHSIIMFLMDPKMEFVKFFGKRYDVNSLADGIIAEIDGHKA